MQHYYFLFKTILLFFWKEELKEILFSHATSVWNAAVAIASVLRIDTVTQ